MATTRKRSNPSGFISPKPEEVKAEEASISEFLEENVREMFETISQTEEAVVEEKPFVAESIIPVADPGPRFLEKEPQPMAKPAPVAQKTPGATLQPKPQRRHPRNVPRFSVYTDQ